MLYFTEASRILFQTSPYLILRVAVYGLIGLLAGFYLGLMLLAASLFGAAGLVVFLAGLFLLWWLLRLLKSYVLYLVQAGHIAVITEIILRGRLPEGVNQIEFGRRVVTRLFAQASILFVVDQLVKGILTVFNRRVAQLSSILPLPGLRALGRLAALVVNFAVTYVDEAILSYNLSRPQESIWESSRRGVILYAQNWRPILKTAIGVGLINLLGFFVLFGLLLIPFGVMAAFTTSGVLKLFWFVMALTLAYGLRLALVNPFSMISMIITYNRAIQGQEPSPEWEGRLEQISSQFRELKGRAQSSRATEPAVRTAPELPFAG